jgi:drug/metabolite transporter (DMT)-like permease
MKTCLTKTILIFITLVVAGVCLIVFGQDAADSAVQTVLPLLGAALFTAGLTYLLVKLG